MSKNQSVLNPQPLKLSNLYNLCDALGFDMKFHKMTGMPDGVFYAEGEGIFTFHLPGIEGKQRLPVKIIDSQFSEDWASSYALVKVSGALGFLIIADVKDRKGYIERVLRLMVVNLTKIDLKEANMQRGGLINGPQWSRKALYKSILPGLAAEYRSEGMLAGEWAEVPDPRKRMKAFLDARAQGATSDEAEQIENVVGAGGDFQQAMDDVKALWSKNTSTHVRTAGRA